MQALAMLTVADLGSVRRFAGTGLATTRKFKGKYMGLMAGDHVIMRHGDPESREEPLVTELLQVASLSIGTLDELHPLDLDFHSHIRSYYPLGAEDEINPDELFIIINFR